MGTKNAALQNKNAEDLGALFDGGTLELRDSSNNVLASFTLQNPAFGSASAGVISGQGLPISTTGLAAAGTGTDAENARLVSSGGTYEISGLSVTPTGDTGVVQLDNTNIADGQAVELSTLDYTVPATVSAA